MDSAWESVPSSHHDGRAHYLLLHATVKWGSKPESEAFLIATQYSDQVGEDVDVSQPAHILAEDIALAHNR